MIFKLRGGYFRAIAEITCQFYFRRQINDGILKSMSLTGCTSANGKCINKSCNVCLCFMFVDVGIGVLVLSS